MTDGTKRVTNPLHTQLMRLVPKKPGEVPQTFAWIWATDIAHTLLKAIPQNLNTDAPNNAAQWCREQESYLVALGLAVRLMEQQYKERLSNELYWLAATIDEEAMSAELASQVDNHLALTDDDTRKADLLTAVRHMHGALADASDPSLSVKHNILNTLNAIGYMVKIRMGMSLAEYMAAAITGEGGV